MNETKFSPVAFDPKDYAIKRCKTDSKFAKAHDALDYEFATLSGLLKARTGAEQTQASKKPPQVL